MCASKINNKYYLNNDDKSVIEIDSKYVETRVSLVALFVENP